MTEEKIEHHEQYEKKVEYQPCVDDYNPYTEELITENNTDLIDSGASVNIIKKNKIPKNNYTTLKVKKNFYMGKDKYQSEYGVHLNYFGR